MSHIHVDGGHHFVSLNSGGRGGYRLRSRHTYTSARARRTYHAESRSALGMGSRHAAIGGQYMPRSWVAERP
jgi:hypothetical protein